MISGGLFHIMIALAQPARSPALSRLIAVEVANFGSREVRHLRMKVMPAGRA